VGCRQLPRGSSTYSHVSCVGVEGLLISNNFMELKSTVFKSNTTRAHFKLACDDIYERFHLTICLLFVSMEMFSKGGSTEWVGDFVRQVIPLFGFEVCPEGYLEREQGLRDSAVGCAHHAVQRRVEVANRTGSDYGWEMSSRGRFATPFQFL
jgi:hypothetical protein